MLYYKYKEEELETVVSLPVPEFNKWVSKHHYGTCTVCGNEYLYEDSPILKKESWNKVICFYKLAGFEKTSGELFDRNHTARVTFSGKDADEEYRKHLIEDIKETVPDGQHCTVCIDCMGKALDGVKKEDIEDCCAFGREYIKKHFGL